MVEFQSVNVEASWLPGTINIPLVELQVRAPFELDRSEMQVIDCTHLMEVEAQLAADVLTKAGFRVAVMNPQ